MPDAIFASVFLVTTLFVFHIVESWLSRRAVAKAQAHLPMLISRLEMVHEMLVKIRDGVIDVSAAIDCPEWLDECDLTDRPDMIAMLGGAYAPPPPQPRADGSLIDPLGR